MPNFGLSLYVTLGKHFTSLGHSFLIHRVFLGKMVVGVQFNEIL